MIKVTVSIATVMDMPRRPLLPTANDIQLGDVLTTESAPKTTPDAVSDVDGEWFESSYATSGAINLNGLDISDSGTDSFAIISRTLGYLTNPTTTSFAERMLILLAMAAYRYGLCLHLRNDSFSNSLMTSVSSKLTRA